MYTGEHADSWHPGAWARIWAWHVSTAVQAGGWLNPLLVQLGSELAVGRKGLLGLYSHGSQFPLWLLHDQRSRHSSISGVWVRKTVGRMAPKIRVQGAHPSLRPAPFSPPPAWPVSVCLPGSSLPPVLFFVSSICNAFLFLFCVYPSSPLRLRFSPSCF